MYLVETPFGLVVASLGQEIGTDDAELLRDRWELFVETLQFIDPAE